jgi:tryptophan halogenase
MPGDDMLKRVVIAGGGTAGWLCACYLARVLNANAADAIEIELVESPEIGILGVGEGTFPSIRGTLAQIGISEAHFVQATGATFKQGIRFVDWVRPAGAVGANHYFHPFNSPSARVDGLDLVPYWLLGDAGPEHSLADAVTLQKRIADAGRGPKRVGDADFQGPMNYAYHFDAARFAALLSETGRALGVKHRLAEIERVELGEQGGIHALHTREGLCLQADLYVDCTGLRARLIGEALGEALQPLRDVLFVDRAVAMQIPYPRPDAPLPSYTISTAHTAGWTWDIALQARRGLGYVYSSRHSSSEQAEQLLRTHAGPQGERLPVRHLSFETGYRRQQWKHNCVAIGLSAGFLEPLESTGIGLIEIATYLLTHLLPDSGDQTRAASHFNRMMNERYARIIDFIKLHYCLSQRRDSSFWVDNSDSTSVPSSLQDRLAEWRLRPPHRLDFVTDLEMFMPASWQFVLYGMEFRTDLRRQAGRYPERAAARREFEMLRQVSQHALHNLPDHRALLDTYLAAPTQPRYAAR